MEAGCRALPRSRPNEKPTLHFLRDFNVHCDVYKRSSVSNGLCINTSCVQLMLNVIERVKHITTYTNIYLFPVVMIRFLIDTIRVYVTSIQMALIIFQRVFISIFYLRCNSSFPNKWSKCCFTNEWECCETRRSRVAVIMRVRPTSTECTTCKVQHFI